MIGLFLVKRLGQNFKIVCLLLILTFFVSCAGTDPNGNNGGNGDGGGGSNGNKSYYLMDDLHKIDPLNVEDKELAPKGVEPVDAYKKDNTYYIAESGGFPTVQEGLVVPDNGVEKTTVPEKLYPNSNGKYHTQEFAYTDGLEFITEEYAKYAQGITPGVWIDDPNGYIPSAGQGGQNLVNSTVDLVSHKDGNLGIDVVQSANFTKDGKFYLFTSTLTSQPLTFSLLLVKNDTKKNRGKFIENVKYLDYLSDPSQIVGNVDRRGDYYWVIDTSFTNDPSATTLTSLEGCSIYMIVHTYAGLTEGGRLKDKNVIKIK